MRTRMTQQMHFHQTVIASCNHEHYDTRKVAFVNIEEDMQGRDVMTFTCPACGQNHKSNVFRSS